MVKEIELKRERKKERVPFEFEAGTGKNPAEASRSRVGASEVVGLPGAVRVGLPAQGKTGAGKVIGRGAPRGDGHR